MTALACVVVFCTTYALILPAVTMERETFCGYTEHTHTDACYEKQLSCGLEEHSHVLSCYSNPHMDVEEAVDVEGNE